MGVSGIKPNQSDVFHKCLSFVFGFKNNKGEVLEHWIAFADGFSYPPLEFYAAIEKEMAARNFPSMETSKVEFAQGGLLSEHRKYFRLMRERLALDVCAAPFGDSYFFSCRTIYTPPLVRLWHILVFMFIPFFVWLLLLWPLGFFYSIYASVGLVVAIIKVLGNAATIGTDLDALLLKIPVLGPIYERFFRDETYYRFDTRLLYLKSVPGIIRELAEEITAGKGVKLLEQYETEPVFGDLYRPVEHRRE